jgi:ABC-type sugar transport system substrate-binding protein
MIPRQSPSQRVTRTTTRSGSKPSLTPGEDMTPTTGRRQTRARITAVVPALVLVAAVTSACSTESDAASSSTGSNDKLSSIQFVNPLPNYPTWKTLGSCMEDEAKARGVAFKQSGPTGSAIDATAMITQVQQAISNKAGAIVTFPASEGFAQVLQQAQGKGIITGTIYGAGGADSGADVNAGPDWGVIGATSINGIAAMPGDQTDDVVAAADTGLGKAWLDGVKAAAEKTDNVTIVGEVYTGDDSAKALPQVNALLTAHPEITDIATHMGTTTPGAVAAIKAKKREGKTFLTAVGVDNGGKEALDEGTVNQVFLQDICTLGKDMANGVVDKAEGKEPKMIPINVAVAGKDDLQSYLDKGWS